MSKEKALEQAKALLKAAKENPEQFQELDKSSRTAAEKQARWKATHAEKQKRGIPNFVQNPDGKTIGPYRPHGGHHFGINHQDPRRPQGQSSMGTKVREPAQYMTSAKEDAADRVHALRNAPKPNLPKTEMEKEEKGVHEQSTLADRAGRSESGRMVRQSKENPKAMDQAKHTHKEKLGELKGMPKANLPKSEMGKHDADGDSGEIMPDHAMKKDAITDAMGIGNSEPPMTKDDKPHPPNSPEDKAHDVSEHSDTIGHAMKILDTPERQRAMLAHLRTLHDPSQARSEKNKEAGMSADEKKTMSKAEMLKAAKGLLELAKAEPQKFEELTKTYAGGLALSEGGKSKHDRCVEDVKANSPGVKNPHAVCVAEGVKPAAWKKSEAECAAPAENGGRMSKAEIKEDLKKPWEPKKYKKMGY